jgi:hypothetical protein
MQYVSVIIPDAKGAFAAELEKGNYYLFAKSDGFNPSAQVPVTVSENTISTVLLTMPQSTKFKVAVADDKGIKSPAKVLFIRSDVSKAPNILFPMFNEESYGYGSAREIYTASGDAEGFIPNGSYSVYALRGNEFDGTKKTVKAAGSDINIELSVKQAVDSSGFLSGDFHIHAELSLDTDVPSKDRVIQALAENLELLVITEHDNLNDLTPFIQAIPGAETQVKAIVY